jgi:hypothetical protein
MPLLNAYSNPFSALSETKLLLICDWQLHFDRQYYSWEKNKNNHVV